MYKVASRWPHQNSIKVEWNLGKRCNLDCSYCPSEIHDNFSKHTDIEILKSTIDKLCSLNKPIRLSLTGGEPSTHPKIEELLKYAHSKNIEWISMTTNGTRPATWYYDQHLYLSQYVFSLHFEKDSQRLLDNILNFHLHHHNMKILVHIMAHHKYISEVKNAIHLFGLFRIPYVLRRIRWTTGNHDLFDDMRYDPIDLDWIKDQNATVEPNCVVDDELMIHANDLIKLNQNKFTGWKCAAGLESLMINWDGEVYRATCRVGGSLGNIYKDTFTVPSDLIVCTRNFCTCEADIPLTKTSEQTPEIP